MPELPEVEVILAQLRNHILGNTIRHIQLGREDIVRFGLTALPWYVGSHIHNIERKGKSLVFTCTKSQGVRYLVAELGMTGLFLIEPATNGYEKHLHMRLTFEGSQKPALYYRNPRRFGRVYLLDTNQVNQFLRRRFGADPSTISQHEFCTLIGGSRGRVKALLLNQHKLAGIGNIYANEILYRAGVHPHARGIRLSKVTLIRLYLTLQNTLKEAIACGGSTIRDFRAPDGSPGKFQECHTVYQKTHHPCPRGCHTPIQRLLTERSSFYCRTCQKRT